MAVLASRRALALLPLLAALAALALLLPASAAAASTPAAPAHVSTTTARHRQKTTTPRHFNRRHVGQRPGVAAKGPICCQWSPLKSDICGMCHSAAFGKDWCAQSRKNCLKCKGTYCAAGGRRDGYKK
jgi:hypothetical protein